jgi:hypothetical protein
MVRAPRVPATREMRDEEEVRDGERSRGAHCQCLRHDRSKLRSFHFRVWRSHTAHGRVELLSLGAALPTG